jgi:hypothetical protein
METNKNKNLNELLSSLYTAAEAGKCADDIRKGDELLARCPAPLPRPALLADIRSQMLLAHYRKRKAHRVHFMYGSAAMAASVALVCGLAWFFIFGTSDSDMGTGVSFETSQFLPVNENIKSVTAQLDQIQDTITAVDSDTTVPVEYQTDIANLESSIWKG